MKNVTPLQFILSLCGYTKIPREIVELSMLQEDAFRIIIRKLEKAGYECCGYKKSLEGQRTITAFLRSGKLLA